jgi:hypothetical protein
MEGSKVNGKWVWYQPDSVVCLACDPKTSGTCYTVADKDMSEDEDSGTGTKKPANENVASDSEEEEKESNQEEENSNSKTNTTLKCSYRKCGKALFNDDVWKLLPCANSACKKLIHRLCFEHFLSISNLQFKVKTDVICCATVRCCSKFKQQSGDRIRWDSDGPNGVNTTPNSQSIILDWWTTGNNYHLFRGGKDDGGKTSGNKKNMVWQMLSEEIKKKGIIVERTAHHVGMKINKMEAEYRKTNDWINQTGQGIIDEGGDITDIVNKRCSYFYLLEPIMADRPGTNPLMVSEAGIDNGTEVDDGDTISSTSIQLAGGDKSIALVDESPVKEVAVTNAVPATAGSDANSRKRPISLQSKKLARGTRITETIMGSINQVIEKQGESKNSRKKEEIEMQKEIKVKELLLQQKSNSCREKIDPEVEKSKEEAELIEE